MHDLIGVLIHEKSTMFVEYIYYVLIQLLH